MLISKIKIIFSFQSKDFLYNKFINNKYIIVLDYFVKKRWPAIASHPILIIRYGALRPDPCEQPSPTGSVPQ